MRPPFRRVTLDGQSIDIVMKRDGARTKEGYGFSGEYQNSGKLYLHPHLTKDSTRKTLFSELLHAAWRSSGLDNTYSVRTEEYIIHELDSWVFQLLDENPDLVEYLFTSSE